MNRTDGEAGKPPVTTRPVVRWTHVFVDRPAAELGRALGFWTAVTGTKPSEPRGSQGEFVTLLPGEGDACVKAQGVGGAHLDLSVEDVAGLVEWALRLGAAVVADHDGWAVLRSPGGQLFCAVPWNGESARPPVTEGPDGTTSRLDQVSIDLAPGVYDAETVFWSELTGWESLPGALPEFHLIRPPAGLPLRILLQRLGTERPTSAHLDLACSDVDAVRAHHEALGATAVGRGARWTVMRDPVGGTYCLTGRDPATGSLP
ncbi:VOC family protein [Streptomyces sp. NBC_00328]|uniref:VOC family protein n=1 Tax=Streptomyces sp. NBC_00328 TaxID=2903646 RepID=UPI002E2E2FC7|nr:VOC family protein [Streptomyces sp. NBC_00328]